MKLLLATILLIAALDITHGRLMFRYGSDAGDLKFTNKCDDCYQDVKLRYRFQYWWWGYKRIYLGSNGYVTFRGGYCWYNPWYTSAFKGALMIAPFWSDIYLNSSDDYSNIWYRETNDTRDLNQAQHIVSRHFGICGSDFKPVGLFIVTWSNVTSYCNRWCPWKSSNYTDCYRQYQDYVQQVNNTISNYWNVQYNIGDDSDKPHPVLKPPQSYPANEEMSRKWWWNGTNTFQLVLATDNWNTFAIMNYKKLDWNYCFDYNKMIFNDLYGSHFYMNPVDRARYLVSRGNVRKDGRWVYKISGDKIQTPKCTYVGK